MSYRVPMCYVCERKMTNPHGLAGSYGMCRDCYDQWQSQRERCVVVPEFVARAVDRLPPLPPDDDDSDIEAERMAERDRLRAGIGTPDELADYEAARRMIQSGE